MAQPRKRVLFFGEAATLSHVVRPWVLASRLDKTQYEVVLCRHPRFDSYFPKPTFSLLPLHSESSERFLSNLSWGRPIFSPNTLARYVKEDLALIEAVKPDLIVGDLRLSLSVSARLKRIPFLNLCNANWTPSLGVEPRVPDVWLRRILGPKLGQILFRRTARLFYRAHAKPINRLREAYGLAALEEDVRSLYTHGDAVLYCDPPGLFRGHEYPPHHHFLGGILWEPETTLPSWWGQVPNDRPCLFITLGSSGSTRTLSRLVASAAKLPYTILVSTLGRGDIATRGNIFASKMIPASKGAARSVLTICNGGSSTAYQALAAGTPVLGVPTNMDQYLNSMILEKKGLGRMLESFEITPRRLSEAVEGLVSDRMLRQRSAQMGEEIHKTSPGERFNAVLYQTFEKKIEEAA